MMQTRPCQQTPAPTSSRQTGITTNPSLAPAPPPGTVQMTGNHKDAVKQLPLRAEEHRNVPVPVTGAVTVTARYRQRRMSITRVRNTVNQERRPGPVKQKQERTIAINHVKPVPVNCRRAVAAPLRIVGATGPIVYLPGRWLLRSASRRQTATPSAQSAYQSPTKCGC